jgi:hypothetical protein
MPLRRDYVFPFNSTQLDDLWNYAPDDVFARILFRNLGASAISPRLNTPSTLCDRCRGLKLYSPACTFLDSLAGLEDKASRRGCELCRLLLRSMQGQVDRSSDQQVQFQFLRAGCYLTLGDARKIVANLCATLCTSYRYSLVLCLRFRLLIPS